MAQKITVDLDRPREVRLTLNAMLQFQDETGLDLQKPKDLQVMGLKEMRLLLWLCMRGTKQAGLIGKIKSALGINRQLTLEEVGELVTSANLGEITQSLYAAREDAMDDAKKKHG